ncbi:MAG: HAD hydrolase-like protein [Actinomycetales bacterium]|nr:HAD hydrolase-like protein [Actinomycetales bacterium]
MGAVGFDLDMTLVDSADGIVTSVQYVLEQYGIQAEGDDIRSTIGLPLDHVFPRWLPDEPYDVLLAAYRAHYREHGIPLTLPMPGAREAIDAVRSHGDRVLVVTAKYGAVAGLALEAAGLDADDIVGDLFAEAKGDALRQHAAWAYVGDHPGDIRAARHAGVHALAVATGPTSWQELSEAGADVVFDDLHGLPSWLLTTRS